jgi:hypothetical protein
MSETKFKIRFKISKFETSDLFRYSIFDIRNLKL